MSVFEKLGTEVGTLVDEKQKAYGDSFGKAGAVMRILYPDGISFEKLDDALTVVRVLDKLFRIATDRDALGESPWRDVAGYALLATRRVELQRELDKPKASQPQVLTEPAPVVVSPRARMLVEKLGYAPAVAIEIDNLCTRSDEHVLRSLEEAPGGLHQSLELVRARGLLLKAMRDMAPGLAQAADGVPQEKRGEFGAVTPDSPLDGFKFGDGDLLVPKDEPKIKEDPFPTVIGDKTTGWKQGPDGKLIPTDPNVVPLTESGWTCQNSGNPYAHASEQCSCKHPAEECSACPDGVDGLGRGADRG